MKIERKQIEVLGNQVHESTYYQPYLDVEAPLVIVLFLFAVLFGRRLSRYALYSVGDLQRVRYRVVALRSLTLWMPYLTFELASKETDLSLAVANGVKYYGIIPWGIYYGLYVASWAIMLHSPVVAFYRVFSHPSYIAYECRARLGGYMLPAYTENVRRRRLKKVHVFMDRAAAWPTR